MIRGIIFDFDGLILDTESPDFQAWLDQTWAGVVVSPLVYAWTGPQAEKLRRMEQAVLAEMRDVVTGA